MGRRGDVRRVEDVLVCYGDGNLLHTRYPEFMIVAFAAVDLTPGFVVADHGWAGVAGCRALPAIGIADCDAPALFVAETQGRVQVALPIDASMPPTPLYLVLDYIRV